MNSVSSNKKLFLLDAFALIYRSYYAFIKNPRYSSKGLNTSAMLGFTNTLVEILEKEKPSHIAVVFDPKGPTFRHKMFKEYKAQRPPMPDDLRISIPYIKSIIEAFNILHLDVEAYEADDVIGTLAKKAEKDGFTVYMMTPDKDYAQLVSDNIFMYKPKRSGKDVEIWGVQEVQEAFGINTPTQVIDILGLMGDVSDNIPGCPGIGPKTAQKFIQAYSSIEGLYENTDKLKGKQKENVINNKEQVLFSKVLATIALDVPVDFHEDDFVFKPLDDLKLNTLFTDLEFYTLIQKLISKERLQAQTPGNNELEAIVEPVPEEKILRDLKSSAFDFYLLEQASVIADLKADLCVQEKISFSLILDGEQAISSKITALCFSYNDKQAFYVKLPQAKPDAQKILNSFSYIFQDEKIIKISYDIKKDIIALANYGIEIKGPFFDNKIAAYILEPEKKKLFKDLSEEFINYRLISEGSNTSGELMLNFDFDDTVNIDSDCEKNIVNLLLHNVFDEKIIKNDIQELFTNIEMPLVKTLASMEFYGVALDKVALKKYSIILNEELNTVEKKILEAAGEQFNVSSPKQLGEILFDKLKLDSKAKRTKSGQYSTSESVLSKLKNKYEIVADVLVFRGLKKLLSTYVDALPVYVNNKTNKIHTSFNQAETATGRLSCTNPNLQNIPIRTKQGRLVREAFIASDENHIFLSADYSQVELRLLAHMSKDENMIDAFNNNIDFHSATAAKIYNIPVEEITKEQRSKAKTANFGIVYGISSFGLADSLKISRKEAKELIDAYYNSYPRVKEYMKECIEFARKNKYVETIMKRRRYLKDIDSSNSMMSSIAERNAINSPVQGSASDLIKLAMVNINKRIADEKLKSKMIIQVHDELNFDCLKSELNQMKIIVKEEMENAWTLSVPLIVDMGFGKSWLDAH